MKKHLKDYCILFIKDIIPVIVGILIALFIDNWNSQRKDKAYINQVFSTVKTELTESNEDIKTLIPQQQALIDSLEYNSDKNVKIQDIVMKSNGISIPQIKINAWKAVSNTKIDLVDYERISRLSNIQELKEILNNKTQFLMTFLYTHINSTNRDDKQTLKMILLDIMQTERSLQKNIEQFDVNRQPKN